MCEPSSPPDDIRCLWSLILEYLASCPHVDCETLHGLVEDAAQVLSKRARERVSLRCLEELISASNAAYHEHPHGTEQKVVLDSSDSCEDVLLSIYQETSGLRKGGSEVLQWDLQPYIMHKKASMPKCTLEQVMLYYCHNSTTLPANFMEILMMADDKATGETSGEEGQKAENLGPDRDYSEMKMLVKGINDIQGRISEKRNALPSARRVSRI